jgi:hypothetical protein
VQWNHFISPAFCEVVCRHFADKLLNTQWHKVTLPDTN